MTAQQNLLLTFRWLLMTLLDFGKERTSRQVTPCRHRPRLMFMLTLTLKTRTNRYLAIRLPAAINMILMTWWACSITQMALCVLQVRLLICSPIHMQPQDRFTLIFTGRWESFVISHMLSSVERVNSYLSIENYLCLI